MCLLNFFGIGDVRRAVCFFSLCIGGVFQFSGCNFPLPDYFLNAKILVEM